jgi:hypothetical protein
MKSLPKKIQGKLELFFVKKLKPLPLIYSILLLFTPGISQTIKSKQSLDSLP